VTVEHLLSVWPVVAQSFRQAKHILLLSDYDGTLTPIVSRPELALLSASMRLVLQTLAHRPNVTVGIISGRALSDLRSKVNIRGIIYAGNHGLEIEGPEISFINPIARQLQPVLRVVRYLLNNTMEHIHGVIVEDKGLTLTVHYRQVDEDATEEVKQRFSRVVSGIQARGKVRVTSGKKVYEVRPEVNWDKGKAIHLLMKRYGKGGRLSGVLPVYLGDDLTDEDGFKFIEKYGDGLSIFVGDNQQCSNARYYLASPDEVENFIGLLLDATT